VTAKKQVARKIYLHAQSAVVGFYEFVEFRCVWPISVQRALLIERWCRMNQRKITMKEVCETGSAYRTAFCIGIPRDGEQ
jgi:hypothetical protein